MPSDESFEFYNNVLEWISLKLKNPTSKPYVLGFCAPQGAGKTTLSNFIVESLRARGVNALAISIDDFYLTRDQQQILAETHPENPYWQQRGYPGTHDIELGCEILEKLANGKEVLVPRYNKSAFGGLGDRFSREDWSPAESPLELLILEGWMLGYQPVDESFVSEKSMLAVNQMLPDYKKWTQYFAGYLQLWVADPNQVVLWRVEAEENMKAQGKAGMTTEQVRTYAEKFLPAYEIYQHTPEPDNLGVQDFLKIEISAQRLPVNSTSQWLPH